MQVVEIYHKFKDFCWRLFLVIFGGFLFANVSYCAMEQQQDMQQRDMWQTIHNGNVARIQELLTQGFDVNTREHSYNSDYNGSTLLHHAARKGHAELVLFLLGKGADVHARESFAFTPLQQATIGGYLEIAKILIAHEADVNTHDINGETPLIHASSLGHINITRLLLECGAHVNEQSRWGGTALSEAARFNQLDAVRLLVEHGADLQLCNKAGLMAAQYARTFNLNEACPYFIERMQQAHQLIRLKAHAFIQGLHPRVGEHSPIQFLDPALTQQIIESLQLSVCEDVYQEAKVCKARSFEDLLRLHTMPQVHDGRLSLHATE